MGDISPEFDHEEPTLATNPTHALTLRLDQDLWEKVRDLAEKHNTTISAIIREAIDDRVEELGGHDSSYEQVALSA